MARTHKHQKLPFGSTAGAVETLGSDGVAGAVETLGGDGVAGAVETAGASPWAVAFEPMVLAVAGAVESLGVLRRLTPL